MSAGQDGKAVESSAKILAKMFWKSKGADQDEALGNLIKSILAACQAFNGILAYGLSPVAIGRALKGKRLGYPSLVQIRRAVDAIAKPIEEERLNRPKLLPIESVAASDDKKKVAVIFRAVVRPALQVFYAVRLPICDETSGLDLVSGNYVTPAQAKKIRALKPLPEGGQEWARLICRLTLSGKYWANRPAMKTGGEIYEAVAKQAMKNRQNKARRAFRARFNLHPKTFRKLPLDKMLEVKDLKMRNRSNPEPLDEKNAKKAKARANRIESMEANPAEIETVLEQYVKKLLQV